MSPSQQPCNLGPRASLLSMRESGPREGKYLSPDHTAVRAMTGFELRFFSLQSLVSALSAVATFFLFYGEASHSREGQGHGLHMHPRPFFSSLMPCNVPSGPSQVCFWETRGGSHGAIGGHSVLFLAGFQAKGAWRRAGGRSSRSPGEGHRSHSDLRASGTTPVPHKHLWGSCH